MNFTKNPFIITEDLALAFVDKRITYQMENELKKRNVEIIKTIECKELYKSIKYHPDICIFNLGEGKIVVAPNVYEQYKKILEPYGFDVIKGSNKVKGKYPDNIQYNIAILGEYAIHNFKYTEENILNYINKKNLKKINVQQGYSKCSICIVDDNSIITSDKGIHDNVKDTDIECLLIEEGYIELFDMNYGFIGGTTGMISKNEIAFYGNIKKHPDYDKIKEFIESRGKEIVELSSEKLLDLGSIVPLMTRKER